MPFHIDLSQDIYPTVLCCYPSLTPLEVEVMNEGHISFYTSAVTDRSVNKNGALPPVHN